MLCIYPPPVLNLSATKYTSFCPEVQIYIKTHTRFDDLHRTNSHNSITSNSGLDCGCMLVVDVYLLKKLSCEFLDLNIHVCHNLIMWVPSIDIIHK